jgi:hypothetical protein
MKLITLVAAGLMLAPSALALGPHKPSPVPHCVGFWCYVFKSSSPSRPGGRGPAVSGTGSQAWDNSPGPQSPTERIGASY